jgi:hypothetical protein
MIDLAGCIPTTQFVSKIQNRQGIALATNQLPAKKDGCKEALKTAETKNSNGLDYPSHWSRPFR